MQPPVPRQTIQVCDTRQLRNDGDPFVNHRANTVETQRTLSSKNAEPGGGTAKAITVQVGP
jgi:hypothetical protein